MDFRNLKLVAPVPHLNEEVRAMACQGNDGLERPKVYGTFRSAIVGQLLVLGTPRRLSTWRGAIMDVGEAGGRPA